MGDWPHVKEYIFEALLPAIILGAAARGRWLSWNCGLFDSEGSPKTMYTASGAAALMFLIVFDAR